MDALLLSGTQVPASQSLLRLLKLSSRGRWVLHWLLAKVVSVLSAEVASTMTFFMLGDNGAKALSSGLDRPVNERKLCNVVLVDHAQDRLFFAHVHLWVLNILLVRRFQFSLLEKYRLQLIARFKYLRIHRRG